jgi:hypothetical protein
MARQRVRLSTLSSILVLTLVGWTSQASGQSEEPELSRLKQEIASAAVHPAASRWYTLSKSAVGQFNAPIITDIIWNAQRTNDDQVNIIMFDSRVSSSDQFEYLLENCYYVNEIRTIACDVKMFENQVQHYGLHQKQMTTSDEEGHIIDRFLVPNDEEYIKNSYLLLIGWVLGHELGHAHYRHKGAFRYLSPESTSVEAGVLNLSANGTNDHEVSVVLSTDCHKKERDADLFFYRMLASKNLYESYYGFLVNLLNKDISRSMCRATSVLLPCDKLLIGTGFALPTSNVLTKAYPTHPPFLVRLMDLLDGIKKQFDYPGGGFHIQVEQFRARQLIIEQQANANANCLM